MLVRHHALTGSRETLRKWMVQAGRWLSRKQRRSFHQPRLRREALDELIQTDGTEHRWFEDRGDPCRLLVFVDDATGRLMDGGDHVTRHMGMVSAPRSSVWQIERRKRLQPGAA